MLYIKSRLLTLALALCCFTCCLAFSASAAERKVVMPPARADGSMPPFAVATIAGNIVFISGQIGTDPETGKLPKNIENQTKHAMAHVADALTAADSDLSNALKINIYLKNMDDYDTVNKIYATYFKDSFPSRTCLEVAGIPMGALIEIEAVALRGAGGQ